MPQRISTHASRRSIYLFMPQAILPTSTSAESCAACRQAEVLNQLTAVSAFAAQTGVQRKEARDLAEREEKLLAGFRMDLADGLQTGILLMMGTATYCALSIGFPQLQLGRCGA